MTPTSRPGLTEASSLTHYRGTTSLVPTGPSTTTHAPQPYDEDKLLFNSGDINNKITVKKAGIIAVCYCQWANWQGCMKDEYWVMAARTTIKGEGKKLLWNSNE
jgi:hypothetical protein